MELVILLPALNRSRGVQRKTNFFLFSVLCHWEMHRAQISLLLYERISLKRQYTLLWGRASKARVLQSGKISCFPSKINNKPADGSQGSARKAILVRIGNCTFCRNHLRPWHFGTVSRLTSVSNFSSSVKQISFDCIAAGCRSFQTW